MLWRNLRLSQLIDQLPLAVIVTRADGSIEYANPQAGTLLEAPEDMLRERSIAEFRMGARFLRSLAPTPVKAEGPRWQDEVHYHTSAGKQIWLIETLVPVFDTAGERRCFVHFLQQRRVNGHRG